MGTRSGSVKRWDGAAGGKKESRERRKRKYKHTTSIPRERRKRKYKHTTSIPPPLKSNKNSLLHIFTLAIMVRVSPLSINANNSNSITSIYHMQSKECFKQATHFLSFLSFIFTSNSHQHQGRSITFFFSLSQQSSTGGMNLILWSWDAVKHWQTKQNKRRNRQITDKQISWSVVHVHSLESLIL